MEKEFKTLREFYPYYLTEHRDPICRALHFLGTALFLILIVYAIIEGPLWLILFTPFVGYSFAWVGHFAFEKNRPATFEYPWFSLAADFIMFWHILTWQIPKKMAAAEQYIAAHTS